MKYITTCRAVAPWRKRKTSHLSRSRSRCSSCVSGFTLVELSIVIVIIGLIIAGVTAGQNLVKSAKLNKLTSQFTQFEFAYRTFQLQYNAIPGDMINAGSYWTGINNGNGDRDINTNWLAPSEHYYIWQHLSSAGLISGTYSGAGTATAGVNHPVSDFGMFFAGGSGFTNFGMAKGTVNAFGVAKLNISAGTACSYCNSADLTPADTKAVDTKLDDGVANTGRLWGIDGDNATASTCSAPVVTVGGADYNLSSTAKACRIFYYLKNPKK